MRITQLAGITEASVDELRYMERKGFVQPIRRRLKQRQVREYRDADVQKVQRIIKYRRQGFTWDAACQRALRDLENPPLFENDVFLAQQQNTGAKQQEVTYGQGKAPHRTGRLRGTS